ncbi:MAG: metallophosphoesterase [Candidatus Kapabacteria bacterium]|nr:metallophosphoesterase [Candidatus Kapabacteria bacterium]
MKTNQLIIFLSIVLTIYSSASWYIFKRGYQAIGYNHKIQYIYTIIYCILFASYIIFRIFDRFELHKISYIFTWIGSFWLAALLYFFLIVLFIDILRLINHFIPFFPEFITINIAKTKQILFISSLLIVALLLIYGRFNAISPKVRTIDVSINKTANGLKNLKIAFVSDIHLGAIVDNGFVKKIVDLLNEQNADIILLGGDTLDEDIGPVLANKSGEPLKNLKARLGVWAITGNHEYIGGIAQALPYLKSIGLNLLLDETRLIDNKFYLVGRLDRESFRFNGNKRAPLDSLISSVENKSLPIILLDHQPFHLEEASNNGIDFQLSGHTHNGQIYPFNLLASKIFDIAWGYKQVGNTQYYVSCGVGTWGPPIRLGNTPEIVVINMKFESNDYIKSTK